MNNDQLRPATGGSIALARGVIIDSRYEILELLGAGGMGTVYKARHLDLNRLAAIKVLHPRYTADAGAVRRFQREARIISKLKHENILSIFGFGGFEQSVYLAMEYVQGVSLGQLVFERKAIQPGEALQYFVQIADAMQHAHDNGVLHRDLKPDNVMMVVSENSDVSPRVVDFGLAKLLDGSDRQRLTRTGEVVGDPRYMSPEQCRGEELDGRSDIYSFGCLMYEVLSGQVPYDFEDPVAIMHNHVSSQPAPFARKQNLPLALESICFKAMTKNRNQR
jgi:serine/threonine-protein kinase